MSEIRLVAITESDLRYGPANADALWDAAITEDEARVALLYGEGEEAAKLRSAFDEPVPKDSPDVRR